MSERRVTFTNLDTAHDVGPFGSNAAQLYVKDGKLWAQLQGETVVEVEDLGGSVTYPAGSYTTADITVDNKGRVTAAASGASHPTARITSFTADGTWTAPSGVTRAKFTIVGGGGGGDVGWDTGDYAGGGGGATCIVSAAVTATTGYSVTVGSAGSGGAGGSSTVVVGATTYTAGGGGGASGSTSGTGGTATNGDMNLSGASGESSGGNEAYDGADGGNAPIVSMYGEGGRGGTSSARITDGKSGIVIVEWVE